MLTLLGELALIGKLEVGGFGAFDHTVSCVLLSPYEAGL